MMPEAALTDTDIASGNAMDSMDVLLPSFIFICILITVGIPGNIVAIVVYGFRLKNATGRYAIISLAVCDVMNCVLSIPVELYIMTRYWNFTNAVLCKLSRYLTYAMNNSSALILLAIAIERYRTICTPHKPKISHTCILRTCILLIIIGSMLALPAMWIYGIQTDVWYHGDIIPVDHNFPLKYNNTIIYHSGSLIGPIPITNTSNQPNKDIQIETKRCLIDDRFRQTWFAYSHFGIVTIATEFILVTLIAIYVQIGRKIAGLRNCNFLSADEERMRSSTKRKKQATFVLFLITLAFEFTFLPFIIITNIRFFKGHVWYNNQSRCGRMVYHFFLRSYYFNNAVNPFIYCIGSSNFRSALHKLLQELKHRVRACCHRT